MQAYDLGIESPDSFVLKYIKYASMARSPDDLTEHEDVLLRGWIRGLFEAEGINDDLMSMCSPKEFHLLVATLFDQSLKACHAKLLAPETLKSGFECRWHLFVFSFSFSYIIICSTHHLLSKLMFPSFPIRTLTLVSKYTVILALPRYRS